MPRPLASLLSIAAVTCAAGCVPPSYDPARATRPYPTAMHRPESADIQVFRDGRFIEIVNATAISYRHFDLWLNRRYVAHIDSLPAGASIRRSLWGFYDVRGEVFNAGGFWRTEAPTPLRLVEIEPAAGEALVGLITIPED